MMKLRTGLMQGVLRWGLPAGLVCGLGVAFLTDRPLGATLAISLVVFGVLGLGVGSGIWARANTKRA